jgi:hypothetical protein
MFYSFVPSKTHAEDKPVFVFFNGGPGAATSSALTAWGTGPFTISEDGAVTENVADFSTLCSLIYIDTRQAGFSFDEIQDPSDAAERALTFNFINYNLYTDAADILLTLLKVLKERPALEENPIVIVAESYGGARSAVLLSMARHSDALDDAAAIYRDAELKAALDDHFRRISPQNVEVAASSQFERQILIQPGMVLPKQVEEAHTLYALCDHLEADDPRTVYCESGNSFDFSDIREPEGFFDARTHLAQGALLEDDGFLSFFGVLPKNIDLFLEENRQRAFRFATENEEDGANFSPISLSNEWDAHHITMHLGPYYSWQTMSYDAGEIAALPFVRSLADVHTLITDAYFDYAVNTSELPAALMEWSLLQDASPLLDAKLRSDVEPDAERQGWMELTFDNTEFTKEGDVRLIRMPRYLDSGHMVTMYQGAEFLADVRAFLAKTGLN